MKSRLRRNSCAANGLLDFFSLISGPSMPSSTCSTWIPRGMAPMRAYVVQPPSPAVASHCACTGER